MRHEIEAIATGLTLLMSPPAWSATTLSDSAATSARPSHLGHEAAIAAGVVAAVALAFESDVRTRDEAQEGGSPGLDRLASEAEHLGNPLFLAPALLLVGGVGGHFDPKLRSSAERIGGAMAAAGLSCELLKLSVGRARPREAGGDEDRFRPFSHFVSFPSGHTTLAFAAARAIDAETSVGWVPWLVYPLAAAVGWSRVHDDEHWTSDVIAGAALGTFAASEAETWEHRARDPSRSVFRPTIMPSPGGIGLGAEWTF